MRTAIGMAILLASSALGLTAATRRAGEQRQAPRPPLRKESLIVHEWGTFTNFSGSDGIQLEFRPLVGEDLPPFVYDRSRFDFNPFIKTALTARQRMETPVAYFYTDRPRLLDVRVDFPRGLLTEFYPPVKAMRPPYSAEEPLLKNSSLSWQIKLHPPGEYAKTCGRLDGPPAMPAVSGDDHYGFARDTDAAVVESSDRAGVRHAEKFLFYRGVGNFSLPLQLESLPGRRFRVVNEGRDQIGPLFMTLVDDRGLYFCEYSTLTPHDAWEIHVPETLATADELGDRMARSLVAAGLYEKEASAMVRTWRSSWFQEPGARLFYLVPPRLTDEIIPLHVEPAPDETVRVLVGRMETLTPETAARLIALLDDVGLCLSPNAEPMHSELARLGRFAEPALEHLRSQVHDTKTRDALVRLLADLRH